MKRKSRKEQRKIDYIKQQSEGLVQLQKPSEELILRRKEIKLERESHGFQRFNSLVHIRDKTIEKFKLQMELAINPKAKEKARKSFVEFLDEDIPGIVEVIHSGKLIILLQHLIQMKKNLIFNVTIR